MARPYEDEDSKYGNAMRASAVGKAVDYYKKTDPYTVGKDLRSAGRSAVDSANKMVDYATTPVRAVADYSTRPFRAGAEATYNAARGALDLGRGFLGIEDTPAQAAAQAPRATPSQPASTGGVQAIPRDIKPLPGISDAELRAQVDAARQRGADAAPTTQGPSYEYQPRGVTFGLTPADVDAYRASRATARYEAPSPEATLPEQTRESAVGALMDSRRFKELLTQGNAGRRTAQLLLEGAKSYDANGVSSDNAYLEQVGRLAGTNLNNAGALQRQGMQQEAEFLREQLQQTGADRRTGLTEAGAASRLERELQSRGALKRDELAAEAPLREAQAGSYKASSRLHAAQAATAEQEGALREEYYDRNTTPERRYEIQSILNPRADSADNPALNAMQDVIQEFGRLQPGTPEHKAMAMQLRQLGVLGDDGRLVLTRSGYADGGAILPQAPRVPQVNPLEQMYRQYAMNTQALGALPIQFQQFVDLLQGSGGDPNAMGMPGYAEGGVITLWNALTGRKRQPTAQELEQQMANGQAPAPSPPQPAVQPETTEQKQRRIFGGSLRAIDEMDRQKYAQGGAIDVSGRQVFGPGTGKSDSIPAIVDGEKPAALSTGEYVMPIEAVQHFGLDRLNKMKDKAIQAIHGRG